jgi:hypothetical protein
VSAGAPDRHRGPVEQNSWGLLVAQTARSTAGIAEALSDVPLRLREPTGRRGSADVRAHVPLASLTKPA